MVNEVIGYTLLVVLSLMCLGCCITLFSLIKSLRPKKVDYQAQIASLQRQLEYEQQLRIDYEKALGLPFYDRLQTQQALMVRAMTGDRISGDIVQMQFAEQIEEYNKQLSSQKGAHN